MACAQLEASFGAFAADEGRALAERAPVDLRVNSLKTNRDKALRALAHLKPEPTPLSPMGLRIAMRPDGRAPPLASDPAYVKGLVELQDEGSQLAALLAEAKPGMQVLDLCAGAGGKSWRSPPQWGTRARSTPPTPTRIALRRSSPGSPARAPAMSRSGPRGGKRTCLAVLKVAAISC